jgi:hypothetical protein
MTLVLKQSMKKREKKRRTVTLLSNLVCKDNSVADIEKLRRRCGEGLENKGRNKTKKQKKKKKKDK